MECIRSYHWTISIQYVNVPSGTRYRDVSGNILIYTVNLNAGYMTLWNSTKCVNPQNASSSGDGSWGGATGRRVGGRTFNASTAGYEWNVTIPKFSGSVAKILGQDRVIGSNMATEAPTVANVWAINLA